MIYTHIEDSSLREAAQKNPLASVRPHRQSGEKAASEQEENHEDT